MNIKKYKTDVKAIKAEMRKLCMQPDIRKFQALYQELRKWTGTEDLIAFSKEIFLKMKLPK